MNCNNCGAGIVPGNSRCIKCGSIIELPTGTVTPTDTATPDFAIPSQSFVVRGKSKQAAGLLGIFLGGLGVHNFYLGRTGRGILQIIITLATIPIGAIGSLWGFIEGILILTGNIKTDAKGIPLQ